MRRKSRKKSSRKVKAAKPQKRSRVEMLVIAFLAASVIGIASFEVYEVLVNGHCWSWF